MTLRPLATEGILVTGDTLTVVVVAAVTVSNYCPDPFGLGNTKRIEEI
jgi:hypothetical protein